MTTLPAALLALADQRLPSGGHVHSGGVEQAISDGLITDVTSLERFLERRLHTTGLVTAGIAAAATTAASSANASTPSTSTTTAAAAIDVLDAETDARTPSPAQRTASRAQGRGLLRTAKACWAAPSADLSWTDLGPRPHHPIVLGCSAAAAGLTPAAAALAAAYLSVSAPSTAAQRLLALDPVSVAAVTVRLSAQIEDVAQRATVHDHQGSSGPLGFDLLPDDSDPLLDLLAQRHAAREERLFAS